MENIFSKCGKYLMSDIIKPRETWFVTNQTNNVLIINDIPSLPKIKAKERIDLLVYASYESISNSVILSRYIGNKWLIADDYLHTHDDKSDINHKHILADVLDVTAKNTELNKAGIFFSETNITGSEAETLTDGSNADKLHKHTISGYQDEIIALFSKVALTGSYSDLIGKPSIPISHTELQDIGSNTHLLIDAHIANTLIHFEEKDIVITESQISNLDKYTKAEVDALVSGLGGDYLLLDGSNADTTINIGSQDFTTTGIIRGNNFISGVAAGTSPYACISTTLNTNLNADLLDGEHGSYYATAAGYVPYVGATTTVNLNSQNLTTTGTVTAGIYSPMSDLGDLIYGGASGAATRLAITSNKFLHSGTTPEWSDITESDLTLSNNTTNDVSTTKHGFTPLLPDNSNLYLNGQGNWGTPATGTANSYLLETFTNVTSKNIIHNFGTYPIVSVLNNSQEVIISYTIIHNSLNDFTVTFTTNSSGSIIASVGSPQPQDVIIVSNNYEVLITDRIIQCDASDKIIYLPSAIGNMGREFVVDNSSTGNITVEVADPSNYETIEGETSQTIPPDSAMNIYSDGSNWRIY